MTRLLSDRDVIDRIYSHVDNKSTDMGDEIWREPADNYRSQTRFDQEIAMMRRIPLPFCPSAALPDAGSYIARVAALTPLLVVRGDDGVVRAFRNACRHRGMAVADGEGCARAFACPYHAWTYGLDGSLKHIPNEHGFPGLDKSDHNLVPVKAEEKGGLVFITQETAISEGALPDLPDLLAPEQQVFNHAEFVDDANWKLLGETSMEGYHIKALHNKSFYPYGYDNLNVVETFGANARIIFPFRRIEKIRDLPAEEQSVQGRITDVLQVFPHTHVSVLSNHALFVILEPVSITQTRWIIYQLTSKGVEATQEALDVAKRDAGFVQDTGLLEDRAAAKSIQDGLATNANTHLTFGRFEKAIVNFHKHLTEHVNLLN